MKRCGFIVVIAAVMLLLACSCGFGKEDISSIYENTIKPINPNEGTANVEETTEFQTVTTKQTALANTTLITTTITTTQQLTTSTIEQTSTTTQVVETENITIQTEIVTEEQTQQIQTTTIAPGIYELPQSIKDEVLYQMAKYPGMKIGVGIYSLDGKIGYVYNKDAVISAGCTIKAPYAMYVLQECEKHGIDIWSETLTYEYGMRNDGSGEIKNAQYGTKYTIAYLLEMLLGISDNCAYNILVSKFPLSDYQTYINNFGGQQLNGFQYGAASVEQRKNEWVEIYKYINSGSQYSDTLRQYLTNTKYCYLTQWMSGNHNYLHKSGWNDSKTYTTAADCAIIDDNYLIIVITQDYSTGLAHPDVVKSIGVATENYANTFGGFIF